MLPNPPLLLAVMWLFFAEDACICVLCACVVYRGAPFAVPSTTPPHPPTRPPRSRVMHQSTLDALITMFDRCSTPRGTKVRAAAVFVARRVHFFADKARHHTQVRRAPTCHSTRGVERTRLTARRFYRLPRVLCTTATLPRRPHRNPPSMASVNGCCVYLIVCVCGSLRTALLPALGPSLDVSVSPSWVVCIKALDDFLPFSLPTVTHRAHRTMLDALNLVLNRRLRGHQTHSTQR